MPASTWMTAAGTIGRTDGECRSVSHGLSVSPQHRELVRLADGHLGRCNGRVDDLR
jgi:hypothetical protein